MPSVDDCELTLPAAFWLPTDERGIPSGRPAAVAGTPYDFRQPRPIGTTRLDTALTGLARDRDGRAWAHLAAAGGQGTRVALWAGHGYRWLQVFTGDPLPPDRRRKAVAIEPMSCPPNAFVTGDDLLVLEPARPSRTPGAFKHSTTAFEPPDVEQSSRRRSGVLF
jgi:aldose 1-epimerase